MRAWFLAICSSLLLMLAAPGAAAESRKVNVLTVQSNTAFQQAEALTVALKRAVTRADGWSLTKGDFSLEVMVAGFGCPEPPDAACLKKIEEKIGASRFVWGTMEKADDLVVVHLRLWDSGEKSETKLQYSANLTDASDEALLKIAESAFGELVGIKPGELVVLSDAPGALASVDGKAPQPLVDGRLALALPEGEHDVIVTADGFQADQQSVNVVSGESVELRVTLTPVGSPKPAGPVRAPDPEPQADSGSNRKLYGWIGVGAGAALIGGGVFSAMQVQAVNDDSGFDRYRRSLSPDEDVCDEADRGREIQGAPAPGEISDQCGKASTFQTLQFVFFGLGAVATGAGVYFLVTDDGEKREAARRSPRISTSMGPTGGRVDLSMSF